jgi:AraC-like DNA-binding protein
VLLILVVQQSPRSAHSGHKALTQAVWLMRLIQRDLATILPADSGSSELKSRPQTPTEPRQPEDTRPPVHSFLRLPGASHSNLYAITGTHRQQLVKRMLDFIHEHYSRPFQLSDLARSVSLNASYVSALFSTAMGVTFHHYLEEYRLALAKKLLQDPTRRVREVAFAVGYSNPNYFRSVFKLREGKSPSLWRIASCSVLPAQHS